MKRLSVLVAALIILSTAATLAQQNGPGGNSPMSAFREQHKYTSQLTRLVNGIRILEEGNKAPLTPAQAKGILKVLNPLRKQDKLTQDQAKAALKKVQTQLTAKQLNEIAKHQSDRSRFGQAKQGGDHRQGPPSGQRPRLDMAKMKNFNPFSVKPDKDNPMAAERAKRTNAVFADLEKKAKKK